MKQKKEDIYEAGFEHGFQAAAEHLTEPRNQTAFVIGIIAGLCGVWGLSHVLNDKVGMGCLWMIFLGPTLAAILGGMAVATAGFGAIVAVPLWLYLVYIQAKNGARNY